MYDTWVSETDVCSFCYRFGIAFGIERDLVDFHRRTISNKSESPKVNPKSENACFNKIDKIGQVRLTRMTRMLNRDKSEIKYSSASTNDDRFNDGRLRSSFRFRGMQNIIRLRNACCASSAI